MTSEGVDDGASRCSGQLQLLNCQRNDPAQSGSGTGTGESYFSLLPEEMVDRILDEVVSNSLKDGYSARAVCRKWKDTITKKLPFGGVLDDSTIRMVSNLDPKISLLKRLSLNGLYQCEIGEARAAEGNGNALAAKPLWLGETFQSFPPQLFSRSVEHLVIGGDVGSFLKSLGKEDEELPFSLSTGFAENHELLKNAEYRTIKGIDLLNILPQLKNVKTMTLSSIAFYSVSEDIMKQLNFSEQFATLTKLDICIGSRTDVDKMLSFFQTATCPHLSSLYVRVYSYCFPLLLFISYYQFIAKHPTLKNLSISQAQSFYEMPIDELGNPNLTVQHYPGLLEDLMEIKLECLRMDCVIAVVRSDGAVMDQWKDLERAFIKNQTELRSLELQICYRSLNCRVDELLPQCEKTLERLDISSSKNIPNHFNCQGISDFKKLKQLHIILKRPQCLGACLNFQLSHLSYAGITRVDMIPPSITSLHLGEMVHISEIRILRNRLVNLNQISYIGPEPEFEMTPMGFLLHLTEHMRFSNLTEFRMYRYPTCPITLIDALNAQKGLICYLEDGENFVIYMDKEEFDLDKMIRTIKF